MRLASASMLDPLSLLPLSLAAHAGRVDDFEAQQLVAAGLTLLQRSAALVRALAGRRSAILLPASHHLFVGLAASEGRGALLLDPGAPPYEIAQALAEANVGAAFTISALADALPAGMPRVLLDDAPRAATVIAHGAARDVDLGSHVGLSLEGDPDAPGSEEEAVATVSRGDDGSVRLVSATHRALLDHARALRTKLPAGATERVLLAAAFVDASAVALASGPLLAGGTLMTMPHFDAAAAARVVTQRGITMVVASSTALDRLLPALADQAGAGESLQLRAAVSLDDRRDGELDVRWRTVAKVPLMRPADLVGDGPGRP